MERPTYQERRRQLIASGLCPETVIGRSRGDYGRTCRRAIKTEGAEKCNLHLSADRRRIEKRELEAAALRTRRAIEEQMDAKVAELRKRARTDRGIATYTPWSWRESRVSERTVLIDIKLLETLLDAAEDDSYTIAKEGADA